MIKNIYNFGKIKFGLVGALRKSTGVSRSSYNLSKIIPNLKNMNVLDLGSGIGFMSVAALLMGAKRVLAVDVNNIEKIIRKNLKINNISQKKLEFKKSNLFDNINKKNKFDVIIANLPQHALPATPAAKRLSGKYGGYDGTDIICRSLTESAYYLNHGGKYYESISELTNYKRTLSLAKSLYHMKIKGTLTKKLEKNEMHPWVTDEQLLNHLKELKSLHLISYDVLRNEVYYKVRLCEFEKK